MFRFCFTDSRLEYTFYVIGGTAEEDNVIKNCLIEYGGNPNNDANINAYYRSAILLENVAINNSAKYGIKLVNDGTGIIGGTNVTFSGNAGGAVLLPDETVVNAMP